MVSSDVLTFITWVDDEPLVYVTLMQKDLVRHLRIQLEKMTPEGHSFEVEMLEITPGISRATVQAVSDRSLVYMLMEFNVTPDAREDILGRLAAI